MWKLLVVLVENMILFDSKLINFKWNRCNDPRIAVPYLVLSVPSNFICHFLKWKILFQRRNCTLESWMNTKLKEKRNWKNFFPKKQRKTVCTLGLRPTYIRIVFIKKLVKWISYCIKFPSCRDWSESEKEKVPFGWVLKSYLRLLKCYLK